jgi:hypothetical protein
VAFLLLEELPMKYRVLSLLLFGICSFALAEEKPNARQNIESYVAAALAGKVDAASLLAVPGQSPARQKTIEELQTMLGVKELKIERVLADAKTGKAIAVSEAVKLPKDKSVVVFALVKQRDQWLLKDIDFCTADAAKEKLKDFADKNIDAKEIAGDEKKK